MYFKHYSTIMIALFWFLVCSHLEAQEPVQPIADKKVFVSAHRGAHRNAPENTLLSFQHAIDMGCDLVEIDVRTTKDGHLILMHDRTVDRTTKGNGRVEELTFKQIRELRFGSKYPDEIVPTFDEALSFCKGKINVCIDHKVADHAQIIKGVRNHELAKNVVIYSSFQELMKYKEMAPEIMITAGHPETVDGILSLIQKLNPETLDGNIVNWTKAQTEVTHAKGVGIWIDYPASWDNAKGVKKGLDLGVDSIQTDHPELIIKLLQEAGRR